MLKENYFLRLLLINSATFIFAALFGIVFVVITVAPAFFSFCSAFSTKIPWTAKQVTFFAPSFFIPFIASSRV